MLPREIRDKLPEGIELEQVKAALSLKVGLDSSWGETVLLLHDEQVLALSRDSVLQPFRVLELDHTSIPRLEAGSWQETLYLTTLDGVEHGLQLSELDKDEALAGLAGIYRQLEAWPALAAVLEVKLAAATVTERRVELMLRLGILRLEHMEQPNEAADLFVRVLERAPLQTEATSRLEGLVLEQVGLDERAAALLKAYRAQQRLGDWVSLRAAQVELCDDEEQRFSWLLELADALERELNDPEQAMAFLLRAWSLRPADRDIFGRLLALAELSSGWEVLIATAESLLERGDPSSEQREAILWEVAKAWRVHLSAHGKAIEALERLREVAPARVDVLIALDELHVLQSNFDALVEVLEARVEQTAAPDTCVSLLLRIAEVQERHLELPEDAAATLERALELDSINLTALQELERLYIELEQWHRAMAKLERQLRLLGQEPERRSERAELCLRLADVAQTHLDHQADTVAWLQRALAEEESLEILERLVALLEGLERHAELSDALRRALELTSAPERRMALLDAIAHAEEALGRREAVEEALRRILEIEPGHQATLEWLRRLLHGSKERAGALADVLEALARVHKPGSPERLEALRERAKVLDGEQRVEDAILAWDVVLEEDSGCMEAYEALVRLHRLNGNLSQVASTLERSIPLLDGGAQSQRLMELGILYEETLHDPEQAARHYSAVLEREPRHAVAFQRQEALCKAERDWAGLIELYLRRAGADEREALEHTLAAARVAEARRGEPERAYQVLMKLFKGHWQATTLNTELARLAAVTGRWRELLASYVALREDHHDLAERREIDALIDDAIMTFKRHHPEWGSASTAATLAELFERRLDNPKRALAYHRDVLQANPADTEAMEGVRRLLRRKERWTDLAQHLDAMIALRKTDKAALRSLYSELVEVYTTHAPSPSQAEQAREALERLEGGGLWRWVAAAVLVAVVVAVWWGLKG